MKFVFERKNYIWLFTGIAFFIAGLVVMTLETAEYGFGFLGLTLGPLLVASGFGIQFYAIMLNNSSSKSKT